MRRCLLRRQSETSGEVFSRFWQHFRSVSFNGRFLGHLASHCGAKRNSLPLNISPFLPESALDGNRHACGLRVGHHQLHIHTITYILSMESHRHQHIFIENVLTKLHPALEETAMTAMATMDMVSPPMTKAQSGNTIHPPAIIQPRSWPPVHIVGRQCDGKIPSAATHSQSRG
jgi:hypothetical protein